MNKKHVKLLVVGLVMVFMLSVAAQVSAKEITFWTLSLSPTFDDYILGVIKDFEAQNPGVTVKWEDVPHNVAEQKTLTAAASGRLPDVLNLNTDYLKKLAALGALVNMDVAAADVKDSYFPGVWSAGEVKGATYALPWYLSNSLMLYNKDLLAKAGWDKAPETWAESWELSRALMKKTGAYGNVITSIHLQLPMHGIYLVSEDGTRATINTPKALKFFTELKGYYDEGLISDELLLGQIKAQEAYAQQQIAWWVTGPQLFRQIKDLAPAVYDKSDAAWTILGPEKVLNVAVMNIAVSASTKNQKEAVEFAKFMTNADNQLAFSKLTAILPSVIEAAENEYFTQGKDSTDPAEKGHYIAAQQLTISRDLYAPVENVTRINRIINDEMKRMFLEDKDVAQALADAEAEINELLR